LLQIGNRHRGIIPTVTTTSTPKTIAGVVERITYQNAETGYTVAKIVLDRRSDRGQEDALSTVVGTLTGVAVGEALELTGYWQHHTQHGWQFLALSYRSVLPATAQGIRKYLGSGLIKGVGPRTADKIVAHFDTATLDVLDTAPERLREVPGIGAKKIATIAAAWREQKAIKDVMVFLQGHGVSTALAVRLYKQYGDASITVAKNEPYRLARDVHGIGFRTADKIALAMGYARDDPERLKAGALFALSEASDDGHTYLPVVQLAERTAELLEVDVDRARQAADRLIAEQGVRSEWLQREADGALTIVTPESGKRETGGGPPSAIDAPPAARDPAPPRDADVPVGIEQAVYLWPFFNAEQNIARQLNRLTAAPGRDDRLAEFASVNSEAMFAYLTGRGGLTLSERQQAGVLSALQQRVSIVTGGPGTGKTTSMRALILALQAKRKRIVLAAPTGRAAKRLSEATGVEAKTLHRLLQLKPGGKAQFDQDTPLPADMVIVDEASMLDTLLMNALLKAVPTGAHLLLVGDADQLPSVGAGNVLGDLIASGVVPLVRLDRIFRQSENSAIATNAHRINSGQMPAVGGVIDDFFMFAEEDAERASALVVDLVTRRIPRRFGFAPGEVQVLAPMHNGKCGVGYLNEALQAALNPPRTGLPERAFGNRIFRVGDKVLQTRNNYDKDVFNGDAGVIEVIDPEDQTMRVLLEDGRSAEYEFTDLDQLMLAYAISIHKSQGSEYPAVVIPLVMSHYMMLERRLIYTAATRARKLVVIVGSRRALAMAIKNAGAVQRARYTGLAARLRNRAP
jgi:exodeoxyribonuclease V alpha subunit